MQAMIIKKLGAVSEHSPPLQLVNMPDPEPGALEILLKVSVCGVCHTELDEIEGRTPPSHLPMVPGHQVVGRVHAIGKKIENIHLGDRVGVAWIYSACGVCKFCRSGNENLCPDFKATGRDAHGGYAQYMTVPAGFVYLIPPGLSDAQAAPLLCAGAVGYRSLRLSNLQDGQNLGLTGFGASGHLVLKMVQHLFPGAKVFVFARSEEERVFARELGAIWAGDTLEQSPEKLDCIIDTTPVWTTVVEALKNLEPGGRLVINAIGKEDIDKNYLLQLNYPIHLWREKEIKSVANVTRGDVREFLALAAEMNIEPVIQEFGLHEANQALLELKQRKIHGAKVLRID
jgi:alcohol dehydrogenase, propanol-preferring